MTAFPRWKQRGIRKVRANTRSFPEPDEKPSASDSAYWILGYGEAKRGLFPAFDPQSSILME